MKSIILAITLTAFAAGAMAGDACCAKDKAAKNQAACAEKGKAACADKGKSACAGKDATACAGKKAATCENGKGTCPAAAKKFQSPKAAGNS